MVVLRVHKNLLHENGLPQTAGEWCVSLVHKNLLHENGHHVHKNLRVICVCCTWFNMAERQERLARRREHDGTRNT